MMPLKRISFFVIAIVMISSIIPAGRISSHASVSSIRQPNSLRNQGGATVSEPVIPGMTVAVRDLPPQVIEIGSGQDINPRQTHNRYPSAPLGESFRIGPIVRDPTQFPATHHS